MEMWIAIIDYAKFFQIASIIFVDSPVRTGFSYSKGYKKSGDFKASKELYQFLRKVNKFNYIFNHIFFLM